jgi:hypothetical protein
MRRPSAGPDPAESEWAAMKRAALGVGLYVLLVLGARYLFPGHPMWVYPIPALPIAVALAWLYWWLGTRRSNRRS